LRAARRRAAVVGVLAASLAAGVAGCGDDAEPTPRERTGSPSLSPEASPRETAGPGDGQGDPTPTPSPPPPVSESPEEQPGGAGDEQPLRVPIRLTVREASVEPLRLEAPAFLGLALTVRNASAEQRRVRLADVSLTVPPGATRTQELAGLRPGTYEVDAGRAGIATLVIGG
jgi:hypothetical protein